MSELNLEIILVDENINYKIADFGETGHVWFCQHLEGVSGPSTRWNVPRKSDPRREAFGWQ